MGAENECYITGNLGRDPDFKYTNTGKPYCRFSVAASYRGSGANEYTEWVPVQVWGPLAEACRDHITKGSWVTVRGRFSTSSWKDSSGNKKYFTQVMAEQVAVVLSGSPYASGGQGGQQPQNNGRWGGGQWGGPAQGTSPQQQGSPKNRGNFGQFGEVVDERPPMEQTSFSDYSSKQGGQVPPPKDEDLPF